MVHILDRIEHCLEDGKLVGGGLEAFDSKLEDNPELPLRELLVDGSQQLVVLDRRRESLLGRPSSRARFQRVVAGK